MSQIPLFTGESLPFLMLLVWSRMSIHVHPIFQKTTYSPTLGAPVHEQITKKELLNWSFVWDIVYIYIFNVTGEGL